MYHPRPDESVVGTIKRIFGRRPKDGKRYCPMCGKKLKPLDFGTFCTMECASKFMDEKEKNEHKADDNLE